MNLTEEDKSWIVTQLDRVATKEDLDRFATKEQLQGIAAQLDRVRAELDRFATREQLEEVETKLLTEFHKWASPLEARQRTHAATLRAIDLEMEAIDDRLKKVEGGKS